MKRELREKTGMAIQQAPTAMEGRRMLFVMSNEQPDRGGDVVRTDGWKLDNFMLNPVFPPMHNTYDKYPLGKWEKVWVEGGELRGIVMFADAGTHPEADLAYSLYKQGIMNAVSVKFLGNEYGPNDHGGLTFTSQELLECSAVPVPANANALAIARNYDPKTREMFLMGGPEDGPDERGADTKVVEAAQSKAEVLSDAALERILRDLHMEE